MTKSNITNKQNYIKRVIHVLCIPFVEEFPFICVFIYLMGGTTVIKQIHGLIVTPDANGSLSNYFEHLGLWTAMAYLLAVAISISGKYKKSIRFFAYLIVFIPYITQEFLVMNFHTQISPTILEMIAETNYREAHEFFMSYLFDPMILILYAKLFLLVILTAIIERAYRKYIKKLITQHLNCIAYCLLPLLLFSFYSCHLYRNLINPSSLDQIRVTMGRRAPHDPITLFVKSMVMLNISGQEMRKAIESTKSRVIDSIESTDSVSIIVVIGESYIKSHCQLYGYSLNTTPFLKEEKDKGNLFVFDDVIAPFNSTSRVMKNMFSCNSIGDGEAWYDYVFFPSIFYSANYNVYFWDNQRDFDTYADFNFSLNSYLYNTTFKNFYHRTNSKCYQYDGKLIDDLHKTINRRTQKSLIIIHLQGQHVDASTRYPHNNQFEVFNINDVPNKNDYIDEEKKHRIADYDNATFYNDWVIKSIIDLFRKDYCCIIYLSDHGDEVYDYRDQYGREHNPTLTDSCAKYEYEIPFMVWCSERYKTKHPTKTHAIKESINKPFMSDNLCHMLFYLAGIKTQYYIDTRNLLSNEYQCPPRLIGEQIDYDNLMKCEQQ